MILIQNVVVSREIFEEEFVCNLDKCKGACCVEGDRGAPLLKEEVKILRREMPNIQPFLQELLLKNISKKSFFEEDDDEFVTTCDKKTGACNFLTTENGISFCGIEQAYRAGMTSFKKPISCHLYPIREVKLKNYIGLQYHRWHICSDACSFGKEKKVKIYQFLKEPLIRRFGEEWYEEMEEVAKALSDN